MASSTYFTPVTAVTNKNKTNRSSLIPVTLINGWHFCLIKLGKAQIELKRRVQTVVEEQTPELKADQISAPLSVREGSNRVNKLVTQGIKVVKPLKEMMQIIVMNKEQVSLFSDCCIITDLYENKNPATLEQNTIQNDHKSVKVVIAQKEPFSKNNNDNIELSVNNNNCEIQRTDLKM